MPHVTLNSAGLLAWVARQVPMMLLYGTLATLVGTAMWAQSVFAVLFLVLNVLILCFMGQIGVFGLIGLLVKVRRWRRRDWAKMAQAGRVQSVQHYVIVPNYKEDFEVVDATLGAVAGSCLARCSIRLVLAMEERDPDAQETASRLCEKWTGSFLEIFATFHPPERQGEVAGKSSNTNWAFQEVSKRAQALELDPYLTAVHVNDADCLWHPDYFTAVAVDILEKPVQERQWLIWQAPQFQLRNHFDVPVVTKMTGYSSALYELGSLTCPWGARICYSSYTMLLSLADRVQGWDVDVIAEDHHMFCKCFFGSVNHDGADPLPPRVKLRPIFLPLKSYLVESASGSASLTDYWASVRARFVQARRHMQGITELSYVLLQWAETVRHHGLLRVPFRVHCGALRIMWNMLCVHNVTFCHLTSVILANVIYAHRYFGTEVMSRGGPFFNLSTVSPSSTCAALEGAGWQHFSCLVFMWAPYAFALPSLLNILGAFFVIVDFTCQLPLTAATACNTGGRAPSEGLDREKGSLLEQQEQQHYHLCPWSREMGGKPTFSWMRWKPVLLIQTALEVVFLSWAVIIAFGFVPELLAVWHLARNGTPFKYVCADKPSGGRTDAAPKLVRSSGSRPSEGFVPPVSH
jgi:hypothetical protein